MEIYNTTKEKLKQADIIPDGSPIPEGWTDKKPKWTKSENWNSTDWVDDPVIEFEQYKSERSGQLKSILENKWLDAGTNIDKFQKSWSNFKTACLSSTTTAQVDTAYNTCLSELGIVI